MATSAELQPVHLPLKELNKCSKCGKTGSLRLCSSCREQAYCSTDCQKKHWTDYKQFCVKTDFINLGSFYPIIACLAEACRIKGNGLHHAQTHVILNSPDQDAHPVRFPDGSAANLVLLGESISLHDLGDEAWWPSAPSSYARASLGRRMIREGFLLPLLTSVCVALLATMTATSDQDSSDGKQKPRARLQYGNSTIADFGIITGAVDIENEDKLAYYNVVDNVFEKGQDPEDHYWLYFTPVRGEELTLDCGLFAHNICLVVADTERYCMNILPCTGSAPAHYCSTDLGRRSVPRVSTPRNRFSFLRNEALHSAVAHSGDNFKDMKMETVFAFMESIADRQLSMVEQDMTRKWTLMDCLGLNIILKHRLWTRWPKDPPLAYEIEPAEETTASEYHDDDWWKYMKKWNRKHKRGITLERLRKAFEDFKARHAASAVS